MSAIEELRKETEKSQEEQRIARETHVARCAAPFVEVIRSRFMPAAKNGNNWVIVGEDLFFKTIVSPRRFWSPVESYESMLLPGCDIEDTMYGLAKVFKKEGLRTGINRDIDREFPPKIEYTLKISWAKKE